MLQFLRNKTLIATIVAALGLGGAGGFVAGACDPVPITNDQVAAIVDCYSRGVDASLDPKTGSVICSDAKKSK